MEQNPLAEFIRTNYSQDGIEVEGEGAGRIRVRMPPEFHDVTSFCGDLQHNFDAHIDLCIDDNANSCVVFDVYIVQQEAPTYCANPKSPQPQPPVGTAAIQRPPPSVLTVFAFACVPVALGVCVHLVHGASKRIGWV